MDLLFKTALISSNSVNEVIKLFGNMSMAKMYICIWKDIYGSLKNKILSGIEVFAIRLFY